MGYDTCLDDGPCEPCLEVEASSAYCLRTGLRQRVVCAGCESPNAPLPFCLPGFRLFWRANDTELATAQAAAALLRNASLHLPASAGLFFRSCSGDGVSPSSPEPSLAPRPSLRGSSGGRIADEGAGAAPPRPSGSAGGALPAALRAAPDESWEVLEFILLNALLLAASGYSLRRQQHKRLEETMQGLYSHVGEGCANGAAPSASSSGSGSGGGSVGGGRPPKAKVSKPPEARRPPTLTPERRQAGPSSATSGASAGSAGSAGGGADQLPSGSPQPPGPTSAAVVPDMFGRSFSAAVAHAGNAIELAMEGSSGARQKMK